MELELFEANNGSCPYLDNRQWLSYTFKSENLNGNVYEMLISQGFRRSGQFFYKNNCPGCKECISIRVPVTTFAISKSQKRTWNKNQDLSISRHPVEFDLECFELYKKYSYLRHGTRTTETNYRDFLIKTAVNTIMMRYYADSTLVGVGWVDVLPQSLSSVYFAFDPDFEKRRLGVFSVLKEIELAGILHKSMLHIGFWVDGCKSMKYKKEYRPSELLIEGKWANTK